MSLEKAVKDFNSVVDDYEKLGKEYVDSLMKSGDTGKLEFRDDLFDDMRKACEKLTNSMVVMNRLVK